MPDPIRLVTRRLSTMTHQIVDGKAQFIWGRVISRNADGTLNLDDGKGGCVLVVPPMNARVGDLVHVDLGATIGGVGMPGLATYSASIPQTNHYENLGADMPFKYVDDAGRRYTENGVYVGTGAEVADIDSTFFHYDQYISGPPPASPRQAFLATPGGDTQIGQIEFDADDSGNVTGEGGWSVTHGSNLWGPLGSGAGNVTTICRATSDGFDQLLGLEVPWSDQCIGLYITADGVPNNHYDLVARDPDTLEILARITAWGIQSWMQQHPLNFPDLYTAPDVTCETQYSLIHLAPNPEGDGFTICIPGAQNANADPESLIAPVDAATGLGQWTKLYCPLPDAMLRAKIAPGIAYVFPTRTDSLQSSTPSTNRPGSYAKLIRFRLPRSVKVEIQMRSSPPSWQTYMFLLDSSGSVISEDFGSGATAWTAASITESLSAGDYTVECTSYNAAQIGDFWLSIYEVA